MKIIDKYFVPYAEYTLRTPFPEDELKAVFEREFPVGTEIFSKKAWKAILGNQIMFRRDMMIPFILSPVKHNRNTFRGKLFIQCQKAENASDTILHITIAPSDTRYLIYAMLVFIILWGIAATCAKLWWGGLLSMVFIGFLFFILECCRAMAADEIPGIRREFEITLRRLEKIYSAENHKKENSL